MTDVHIHIEKGPYPTQDLTDTYRLLADELKAHDMYAEQSGGLALNYGFEELGMNPTMLHIFKSKNVAIRCASDAHKPEDVGANIAPAASYFAGIRKL